MNVFFMNPNNVLCLILTIHTTYIHLLLNEKERNKKKNNINVSVSYIEDRKVHFGEKICEQSFRRARQY